MKHSYSKRIPIFAYGILKAYKKRELKENKQTNSLERNLIYNNAYISILLKIEELFNEREYFSINHWDDITISNWDNIPDLRWCVFHIPGYTPEATDLDSCTEEMFGFLTISFHFIEKELKMTKTCPKKVDNEYFLEIIKSKKIPKEDKLYIQGINFSCLQDDFKFYFILYENGIYLIDDEVYLFINEDNEIEIETFDEYKEMITPCKENINIEKIKQIKYYRTLLSKYKKIKNNRKLLINMFHDNYFDEIYYDEEYNENDYLEYIKLNYLI